MILIKVLIWLASCILIVYLQKFIPYNKLSRSIKVIYGVSVIAFIFGTIFILVISIDTPTFSNEGLTKGVLTRYKDDTRSGSFFWYKYKLDREYIGSTSYYKNLAIGDTIDIIYDKADCNRPYNGGWDDSPPSYSAFSRYYSIIGDWGYNTKYKKYLDKIKKTGNSKNKYVGVMP